MKIALLDLVHTTCGTHSNTVPLGIGLIGAYIKKNVDSPVEIRLFKEADKALKVLKSWQPDVVGIAQYTWGAELNLEVASLIKKKSPDCLVVAGGPNLAMDKKSRIDYLKKNKFIDICIAYDAEIPFLDIIQRLLQKEKIADLRKNPGAGTYSLDSGSANYMESELPPPRLKDLDAFGPVYADGIFDEFLDQGYHPFTQTHRGCPFSCAYCRTSDLYNSKMLFQSPEIFKKDIEYLAKRFAGQTKVMFYIGNTNMSLFPQDFEIAKIIRIMQDKYQWPKYVYFDTGKDPQKLLDMLSIIRFVPAPALQTLTPKVLANINRRNLPLEDYINFQKEILLKTGENSMSELIMCLPGETKKTFLDTLRKVINSGVQNVVIYTLIKLTGTPLSSEAFSKKYKYLLRYRVVPRQFSIINGKKIIEIEEVIVGTKDTSFKDYLELRGIYFTVSIFSGAVELAPLKKFLLENKVDLAQWLFNMHKSLKKYPGIYYWYKEFLKETKEELFSSRQELLNFFAKEKNFKELISGKRGDNLLRKYKHLVLSECFQDFLRVAIDEAQKVKGSSAVMREKREMLQDLALYLSTRDLRLTASRRGALGFSRSLYLRYNIPQWIEGNYEEKLLLDHFKGDNHYKVAFNKEQKRALKHLNTHKNLSLSLQILYRDGNTKDLWPKWIKQ